MKRREVIKGMVVAGLTAGVPAAIAQTAASGTPDLFSLLEYIWNESQKNNAGNKVTKGKTRVVFDPNANNCILVTLGDSLGVNIIPTPYTPSNPNVLNFNIYDGLTYKAADPLLGCSGIAPAGNMFTRLGDAVQGTDKFANTILVPANIGGTYLYQWADDQFLRIKATFARLAAAGVTPTAVLIELGANETQLRTSQSDYEAQQKAMVALIRRYFAGPIFIATESWLSGEAYAATQAAQTGAVDHGAGIWAGPNGDSLGAEYRPDKTHWNDVGAAAMAKLWLSALQAYGAPFA